MYRVWVFTEESMCLGVAAPTQTSGWKVWGGRDGAPGPHFLASLLMYDLISGQVEALWASVGDSVGQEGEKRRLMRYRAYQ